MKRLFSGIIVSGFVFLLLLLTAPVQEASSAALKSAADTKLSKATVSVEKGERKKLRLRNRPAGASVSFKSSKPKVAKVTKYGNVYGKRAGKATITVTVKVGNEIKKLKCRVTVTAGKKEKETQMNTAKRINSLYYSYNNSFGDGSYSVELSRTDEGILFTYSEMMTRYEYEPVKMDEVALNALEIICEDRKIEAWNGFHESDDECLDGDGFSLSIGYEDGMLSASGSNAYPDGYYDFITEFKKVCEPYINEIREAARQKYLTKKHEKNITSFMISISNSDYPKDHDIFIRAYIMNGVTTLEYRITLGKDDLYKAGYYHFYGEVPSKRVDFSKLEAIVSKYDLNRLNDITYDETGDEWYQIEYCYGEDYDIGFMGSKPFENYAAVRSELMDFIFGMVEE